MKISFPIFNLLDDELMIWKILSNAVGIHTLFWDGRDKNGLEVSSGIYIFQIIYRATANSAKAVIQNRKMTLVR